VVNGLKICEGLKNHRTRVGWAVAGAFVLALAVAVPVVLWANYNYGAFLWDKWALERVPDMTFSIVEDSVNELSTTGELAKSVNMGTLERLAAMRPDGRFLKAAGIGLGLVLVFSARRMRFARFPIHPVLFLVWGIHPLVHFGYSFMLGWLIKSAVMKYGARTTHRTVTVFMFGAIAGDLLGGLIFMAAGAIYYLVMGATPIAYRIFPG